MDRARQPKYFDRFRCIGADCEDTCCAGWGVVVDQETYEKYQSLPAHRIANKPLSSLVEINPARSSAGDFANFRMEDARCPALNEGWCAIQQTLGEPYIPNLCSKYPRVLNVIGGAVERSLHLSCPEAARLVLDDPEAMVLGERMEERPPERAGGFNFIADDPDDCLYQVRTLMMEWIRGRSRPLWQRIVSLGFAIDRLAEADMACAATVLEDFLGSLKRGSFDDALAALKVNAEFQLETVLDLVVIRLGSDYTPSRFVECYTDFMRGLRWTPEASMEELAARYSLASERYFMPFVRAHEHVLENYLANYIFRTVFPYRSKLPDETFAIDSSKESMRRALVLLAVHYAIVRTMLIGMAALYKNNMNVDHAVKLLQSHSKAFLHSSSFDAAAIEYLGKAVRGPANKVAELVMD